MPAFKPAFRSLRYAGSRCGAQSRFYRVAFCSSGSANTYSALPLFGT